MSARIHRRTVLKSAGATIALPLLDAMGRASGRTPASSPPPRLGFLYLGTGWNTRELFLEPAGRGRGTPGLLEPLDPYHGDFTMVQKMFLEFGGSHDDDHTFLTGSDAIFRARAGKEYKNSISCDQVAAGSSGKDTRFPSLELSERRGTGFGGQGLRTIAWSKEGVPLVAECDPHVIFQRLFGMDGPERRSESARRFRQGRSVLDGMREQATELERALGGVDRERLDQYLTALREVERQIERESAWDKTPKRRIDPELASEFALSTHPEAAGFDYRAYARMMYDLIALAWQTDSTRVVTYVVRRELHSHYPGLQSTTDYHSLTHHGEDSQKLDELARIDRIYLEHFAYFLTKLKSIREGDGTLLDRCLIGVSSGMGMGHSRNQLPTLVAGGKALGIRHRGFVRYSTDTPLANLWTTMLERADALGGRRLPGSTGILSELL
jgi:hypothetical protein